MTNEQILKKAIEKAVENGFKFQQIWSGLPEDAFFEIYDGDEAIHFSTKSKSMSSGGAEGWSMAYNTFIFSHSFAKAFWGEADMILELPNNEKLTMVHTPAWEYHLQQLVLEEQPLKYIEKFL